MLLLDQASDMMDKFVKCVKFFEKFHTFNKDMLTTDAYPSFFISYPLPYFITLSAISQLLAYKIVDAVDEVASGHVNY